jgi:hypothetical protein
MSVLAGVCGEKGGLAVGMDEREEMWGLYPQITLDRETALPTLCRMPGDRCMTIAISGEIAKGMRKPMHDGRDVLVNRKGSKFSHGTRRTHAWGIGPAGAEEGEDSLRDNDTVPQEL